MLQASLNYSRVLNIGPFKSTRYLVMTGLFLPLHFSMPIIDGSGQPAQTQFVGSYSFKFLITDM